MPTFTRSMTGFAIVVVVAWVLHLANRHLIACKITPLEHKTIESAPATLATVSVDPAGGPRQARLCFTIDSFANLPDSDRPFYENSERTRLAVKGPLCMSGRVPDDNRAPAAGEKVQVYFTLENGGLIAPTRMEWNGREIAP